MQYETLSYITQGTGWLTLFIAGGIVLRIVMTISSNMGDENNMLNGVTEKKVKRLIKAGIVMVCTAAICGLLYNSYFKEGAKRENAVVNDMHESNQNKLE